MAMNGGIYAKSYAPLGLYIEKGVQKVPLNRASGGGNFFYPPRRRVLSARRTGENRQYRQI